MSTTFALPKVGWSDVGQQLRQIMKVFPSSLQSLKRALGHIEDKNIRAEVTELVEEALQAKEEVVLFKEQLLQQALQAKEEVVLSKEQLLQQALQAKEEMVLSKEQLLQQALQAKEEVVLSKEQQLQQEHEAWERLLQAKEEVVLSKEQALQATHHQLSAVQEAYAERTKITTAELARTKGLLHMRGAVGALCCLQPNNTCG